MPLKQCSKDGKKGWSWGNAACQVGPGAKKRAIKMGLAIEGETKFKQEMSKAGLMNDPDVAAVLHEVSKSNEVSPLEMAEEWIEQEEAKELAVAYVSVEERKKIAKEDFGDPENRKYPADTREHFDAAVKLLGRAPKNQQSKIKERLKKIAERRGYPIPQTWE